MSLKLKIVCSQVGIVVSFTLMLLIAFLRILGGLIARLIGGPKTPLSLVGEVLIFAAGASALAAFFKWPLLVVIVSWIDMTLILTHLLPWGPNAHFFPGFSTDFIFFISAHVGMISVFALRHLKGPNVMKTDL